MGFFRCGEKLKALTASGGIVRLSLPRKGFARCNRQPPIKDTPLRVSRQPVYSHRAVNAVTNR